MRSDFSFNRPCVCVCVCVFIKLQCVCVFFTLTDRASIIPSNIRGCQSGTWSAGQEKIRGTSSTKLQREHEKTNKNKRLEHRCWVCSGYVQVVLFVSPQILKPNPMYQLLYRTCIYHTITWFPVIHNNMPVLSTCPLHTNSGCGKERRILIGPW